ncbi:hypothetical protein GCM10010331_69180 [Streptomyces xanthochromogenes]|uniref:hypothetical protein n=1 Tax=Streptomyces xanthochromogenes TaxID=67384 RepID=UPI0016751161|nr:hypothetical protein [Streptomyces xanthochromogenes]GHB71444.1 hypothetical protein GCM10010331_69180 [Streptomyces xanthochromogenes]
MSASGAAPRVARFYTSARRHPWVLGKVADFKIPLGPYTPAQIAVAGVGGLLLVETVTWWSWLGPLPLAAWVVAIWMVRRPKFAGRAPLPALAGWLTLLAQPAPGRIGGRVARDRMPHRVFGGFVIENLPSHLPTPRPVTPTSSQARRPRPAARRLPQTSVRSASPAQRLLAQAAARPIEGSRP